MSDRIFLLLGSNQGEPEKNLAVARERIAVAVRGIVATSSLYRTAAWGKEQQPEFCNQVIEVYTHDTPERLLEKVLDIERGMGRIRKEKWGPRIIDIDLLLYGREVRNTETLQLPHPGIPLRRFTLLPLAEIAGDFVHPVFLKTINALLSECTDPLMVRKIASGYNAGSE